MRTVRPVAAAALTGVAADPTSLAPCPSTGGGTPVDTTPADTFADEFTKQLPRPTLRLDPDAMAITVDEVRSTRDS